MHKIVYPLCHVTWIQEEKINNGKNHYCAESNTPRRIREIIVTTWDRASNFKEVFCETMNIQ